MVKWRNMCDDVVGGHGGQGAVCGGNCNDLPVLARGE